MQPHMADDGAQVVNHMQADCMDLPPGFRFHPTDEEIITHYLSPKVLDHGFSARAVGEVDLNKCEPWDLPSKAKMGEKQWYFFCQRDRKYPTGMRTNRATEAGYWKATGKDKEIYRGKGVLVGMKKTLVFYKGRAPQGDKTNWVMHEYRIQAKSPHLHLANLPNHAKDEWVVCRVFHKSTELKKTPPQPGHMERADAFGEGCVDASSVLPPHVDLPLPHLAGEDSLHFNGVPSFPSLLGLENQQRIISHHGMNSTPPRSATFRSQMLPQSSYYAFPDPASGYLHQGPAAAAAAARHCKVEQYSNPSMGCPSQDTGLSTDHNADNSSVMLRLHYGDLDELCSAGPTMDYDSVWKY